MSWETIILIVCCILCLIYLYLYRCHMYWQKRGVPSPKPNIIFGNYNAKLLCGLSLVDAVKNEYKENSHYKFFGLFSFQRPILFANDPELIKLILLNDFKYFPKRGSELYNKNEPLTHNILSMKPKPWKMFRRRLTVAYSSGKIKSMFSFIKECADSLKNQVDNEQSLGNDINIRDMMARFTTDIISSCNFGIITNSLKNPDAEFRKMGIRILNPRLELILRFVLKDISKTVKSLLPLNIFEKPVAEFFNRMVADVVNYREKNGVIRGDFLDVLIAMKKEDALCKQNGDFTVEKTNGQNTEMTLERITAHCLFFFIAGFETSSSTSTFCLLELARNIDIQKKVQSEIDTVIDQYDGELTYEALNDMNYLNMAVLETLRMYPSLSVISRKCVKDYNIPDTNVIIEKGTEVAIPIIGLHHDERYYKNPETFNPENFTEEMKSARPPCTFLGFGEGPRNCMGARFGLVQTKIAIITILRYYNIELSEKTELPIKYLKNSLFTTSRHDIWLKFSKRGNCGKSEGINRGNIEKF